MSEASKTDRNDQKKTQKADKKALFDSASSVSLRTVIFCCAATAILSISGGAVIGGLISKSDHARLDTGNEEWTRLSNELSLASERITSLEDDLKTILRDVNTLESAIQKLESSRPSNLDVSADLDQRVSDLENLAFEPQTLSDLQSIRDQLSALDKRLLEIENNSELTKTGPVDLTELQSRVSKIEADFKAMPKSIPAFPREKVVALLKEEDQEKSNWLSRTLGPGLTVVDADILDRLDRIEDNLARHDIKAVRQDVASLPQNIQIELEEWLANLDAMEP